MKKILSLLIWITPFICSAQKQGNIWYFGVQSGLDFSSGTPVAITGGQTGTDTIPVGQEGTSSISDSAGSILFYTSGRTIWNWYHNRMPNGSELMGGQSSTQSSIIIPQPGNVNQFYVFTSDEMQSYPSSKGYRYSIVNMCLDHGNGDILPGQKNILLLDSATEKLAACQDLSGSGYWIVGHKMFSDEFQTWHLTSTGISGTAISHIGTIHGWESVGSYWQPAAAQGQMKLNPTGTKLAVAIGNNVPAIIDLFDFSSTTGIVSNCCHIAIDSAFGKQIYGVEFSPDGSKLYATLSGGFGGKRIYQYDLTAGGGNCTSVIASRSTIFQSDFNSVMFGMQLAPNNKIYVVSNSYNDLGCINFPNLTGAAVGFDSSAIAISGVINNYTLPSFIAGYKYNNVIPDCSMNSISENMLEDNLIGFYPNPVNTVGTLKIDMGINIQDLQLYIYDVLGRVMNELEIKEYESTVNTGNLSKGIYFYELKNKYKILKTGRIIVE